MKEWLIMITPIWSSVVCVGAYYWGYHVGRKRGQTEIPARRTPRV